MTKDTPKRPGKKIEQEKDSYVSSELNLQQRKLNVMKEISGMEKTGQNRAMKYAFITIDDVVNAVRKSFIKNGISFLIDTKSWEVVDGKFFMNIMMTFINVDNPDDKETVTGLGMSSQVTDTAPGKAIAYCVKNQLLKTLLIPGGKHEDVELEDAPPPPAPVRVAVAPTPQPDKRAALLQIREELGDVLSLNELRTAWGLISKEHGKEMLDAAYPYYKKMRESFTK